MYLAVKAAQNGGTIIEKFFIAAYFRKNLSLGGKEKQAQPKIRQETPAKPLRTLNSVQTLKVKKQHIDTPPVPMIALMDSPLTKSILKDLRARSITKIETVEIPEIKEEAPP